MTAAMLERGVGVSSFADAILPPEMRDEVIMLCPLENWRLLWYRKDASGDPRCEAVQAFLLSSVLQDPNYRTISIFAQIRLTEPRGPARHWQAMAIPLDTRPMEARLADTIPTDEGWQFEPKWDGFRCLAFRDGDRIELMSKSGNPLARYFPEIVAALREPEECCFVLDGELVLPLGEVLSFAALQLRLHPAASRIERLARETPAQLMLFDALQIGARKLVDEPLSIRREALEALMAEAAGSRLLLSPSTSDRKLAERWFAAGGEVLDGIVAKRLDASYRPGERSMVKVKRHRTADCVVGGYRLSGKKVGSLLLGLYDDAGKLNYIGFTSSFSSADKAALLDRLRPLEGDSAFTGTSPGGLSRWSPGRTTEWVPLRPELVAEVIYDQVTGQRFRHGTTFHRWRPDKAPRQCTIDQLAHELRPAALAKVLETA